ncbi:Hemolysin-type calcium-binding repeat-containing protein [Asticcacaulis taihuensis]|uniref:Hemolysin-type calcium-binding repeat-containing protein n=2 Tax=Asticcacaulis taihuensis TaxID=260084 RepID=A0A1G4R7Q6_9CAUL|nr:Hemolysin-type calcium-binding repeat-containing protein [Asticcacaulis taihuensis]
MLTSGATDLTTFAGDLKIASDYNVYGLSKDEINALFSQAYDTLAPAQKQYYQDHKAFIDMMMATEEGTLSTVDANTYAQNKVTIDAVISALSAQAAVNPWIITLQRAGELKLDQFATSDFYGGLAGFLDSFGVANVNSKVHFEDVHVNAVTGGGMRIGLDKVVTTTDPYSAAAKVYRLYQGLLDRAPDGYGLTDYTNYIQLGEATLEDVASSIISSQEFVNRVGANLSDWDFVVQLYATVQNRGATNAEIQSWVDTINNGASRAQVAIGFTESNEYVNNSASFIQNGLTYTSHAHQDFFTVLSQSIGWDDELVIDQVSQVGLTSSSGVTSNSSDFVDMSASATGVTVNDWRQVSVNGSLQWQSGGDNIFIGSAGNDTLAGGTGSDWLMGSGGYDIMWGGDGNDVLINPNGGGELHGEAGDDYVMGGWGYGDDGNDTMVGRAGYDSLVGGNGDDLFLMAKDYSNNWYVGGLWATNSDPNGSDTLSAERLDVGVGFDIDYRPADWNGNSDLTLADAASRSVNLYNWATGQWLSVMNVNSIENATGSLFGDLIYGTTGDNVLRGLAGNDTLYGRAGDDVIEGGAGVDTLYGGAGKDVLSYENSSEGVYVNMATGETSGGDAAGDVFTEFESLRGSNASDQLRGDSSTNVIEGLDGDDWIIATAGGTSTTVTIPDYNDWSGYGGPRQITYWTGGDVYNGGSGNDTVDYSEATSGVTAYLGSYTISNSANTATAGTGSAGLAQGHTYISIESIVGSNYNDSLSAGAGAQSFEGGAGNDFLSGGAGADTYYFGRGDGSDTVTETNADNNTVVLGANITVSDMYNPTSGGSSGFFDVGIRGTSDIIRFSANFADLGNNRLKTISFNGQSSLDVSNITYQPSGATGYNDALNGWADQADLVQGFEGNDVLTGSGTSSESKGNIFIGGTGNDTLTASVGDDQYAYDRGDGIDTITDSGGDDTIVFGSTVAADDVVFKVVGNDLYIGLKDKTNTALTADQVSERIKIVNGGVQYKVVDGNDQTTVYSTTLNTIEYVQVGGTTMDLTKLNIDWTVQTTWQYGDTYPIVLDLGGDGLNLTAVEDSDIIVKTAQGGLSRLGWASAADAFLAVDRDGDGAINKLSEISFAQDKEGATSDLEGLKTWDTNGDGILNASDENFDKILVWQDLNQNGRSTARELRTLTEAGIIGIDLNGTATGYTPGTVIDNYVQNTMSFIWADGARGDAYDVALARHVLGTDGLYAGAYQAEWGARDEDGTLGRLLNDPETAAKAALVSQRRTAVEDLVASYDEVSLKARVDFTDTDEVSAEVAERIAEMNHSERAAWLSGQTTTVDDKIRLMSSAQTIAVQLDQAEQATDALVSTGLDLASESLSGSGASSSTGGNSSAQVPSVQANGAGITSELGVPLTASEPIGGVVNTAAANGLDNAWWRQQTLDVANGVTSLGALMASMYGPTVTAVGSGPEGGIVDDTLTRQQLILLQSMAGFGSSAGGEAAIWQRGTPNIEQPLAASSGVRGVSQDAGAALVA